jgi:hypothetical protein
LRYPQRGNHACGQAVDSPVAARLGERYEEWNYYHGSVRIPGGAESPVKVLEIKFDQRGVVRGYNWSGQRG